MFFLEQRYKINHLRQQQAKKELEKRFGKSKKNILSFCSFKGEIDTKPLNSTLSQTSCLYLPKVSNQTLDIYQVSDLQSELKKGYKSILEPFLQIKKRPFHIIDIVLVPAIVFDLQGYRLGYGKGFYDRFIRQFKKQALFIGIGFKEQITIKIPTTKQDQKIDQLILF